MFGDFKNDVRHGPARRAAERHTGFFGRAIAFFDIAAQTGGDDIVPAVKTAARTRNNVINGQVMTLITAILAGVIVTMKNVAPRETDLFVRNLHIRAQTYNCRNRCIGVDFPAIVLDLFGLALHEQDHRSPPGADIERLVGCVKDQDL